MFIWFQENFQILIVTTIYIYNSLLRDARSSVKLVSRKVSRSVFLGYDSILVLYRVTASLYIILKKDVLYMKEISCF